VACEEDDRENPGQKDLQTQGHRGDDEKNQQIHFSTRIDFDKNSLWGELNISKGELYFKKKGPQDMKEGFRPVSQITITT
jgi:hypothetical protein